MRALLALLTVVVAFPARGDDRLPPETLAHLKAATVFVKVETAQLAGSGSGFVIRAEKDTVWVMTNDHVANPVGHGAGPGRRVLRQIVLNSGRKGEKVLPAQLVAADPDRDLAVLRVNGVTDPPKPVDLTKKAELFETLTVYTFGFPFGEALSSSRGNPAATVGRTSISSLREDDRGDLDLVQLEGGINPGNSGGPVVDAQGRLVGVAVSKLRGAAISFAIAPGRVARMLDGRISGLVVTSRKLGDELAELTIEMGLIDPFERVRSASARVAVQGIGNAKLAADAKGVWPALPEAEIVELKLGGQKAVGSMVVKVPDGRPRTYLIQPVYTTGGDVVTHAQPAPHRVDFTRAVAAAPRGGSGPAPPPERAAPQRPARDTPGARPADPGLGRVVDEPNKAGLRVRSVTVGPANSGVRPATPACLCWSEDGKAFYHLNTAGTVRRIRLADLAEEGRLDTKTTCAWLCRSAAGLVLTVTDAQEAWVLDPRTLAAGVKVPIAGADRVVSAPGLSVAFAVSGRELGVLDLKAGKVIRQYAPGDLGERVFRLHNAVVSPDGKYLYGEGGIEQLMRFAIDGDELKFDAATARIAQGAKVGVCLSEDGSLVCYPTGGGNYPAALEGQKPASYATQVFRAEDLSKPAFLLRSGPYPQAVGFDLKAGRVYAENIDHQLIVFDDRGVKLKEYQLIPGGGMSVRQILPHPAGGKVLLLTETKVYAVELPQP